MNVFNSQSFPFLSQLLFLGEYRTLIYYLDPALTHASLIENGTEYDQLLILNDDYTLNQTKLEAVGLPWFAGSQVIFKASRTMYIGGESP